MSLIFYSNGTRNGRVTVSNFKGITTKVVVIMGQRISNHDGNVFSNGLNRTPGNVALLYKQSKTSFKANNTVTHLHLFVNK